MKGGERVLCSRESKWTSPEWGEPRPYPKKRRKESPRWRMGQSPRMRICASQAEIRASSSEWGNMSFSLPKLVYIQCPQDALQCLLEGWF